MVQTIKTLLAPVCLASLLFCSAATATPRPDCTDFNNNDQMGSYDRQWCQALAIKENYLADGFVETVPGKNGRAREVSSRLGSRFSSGLLGDSSSVGGRVTIGDLTGRFRLRLARTNNTLSYGRKIKISGTARSGAGRLEIYSYVDVDLWKLSAVLVDSPVRGQEPPETGLILKGYTRTEIAPGTEQKFTANLIPIGGDFFLLLRAPDGIAKDIQLDFQKP
ncbi:hypothetical protein ACG74X_13175 [Marivita sp. S0852]|uniref:hypothetical protein n=1 Tax=Marivita sp. S0852 TaxID=3373893 RepID=UPI003981D665